MAKGATFDPDATHAMAQAFDGICVSLQLPFDAAQDRERIARRVIELARNGELDPVAIYGRIIRERSLLEARPA